MVWVGVGVRVIFSQIYSKEILTPSQFVDGLGVKNGVNVGVCVGVTVNPVVGVGVKVWKGVWVTVIVGLGVTISQ
jgi:hypothetical protein